MNAKKIKTLSTEHCRLFTMIQLSKNASEKAAMERRMVEIVKLING